MYSSLSFSQDGSSAGMKNLYRVVYEQKGSDLKTKFTAHPETIRYLKKYVQGKAQMGCFYENPDGKIELLEPLSKCPRTAKVIRVQDCTSGKCVTLKGLYYGRAPALGSGINHGG